MIGCRPLRCGCAVETTTDAVHLAGTVTSPDPGVPPSEATFVYKVLGPTEGILYQEVASQWEAPSQQSWTLSRHAITGDANYAVSPTGTNTGGAAFTLDGPPPTGDDELLAFSIDRDVGGGNQTVTLRRSVDGGVSWAGDATRTDPTVTPFDATSVLRIGDVPGTAFNGRIYWVELRTGLDPTAGTVLWRFDAADYPGTGSSYVDPRGRIWTLSAPSAIVAAYAPLTITPGGESGPTRIESSHTQVATESPDTRPGAGARFDGMRVWTTDTKRLWVWDGTAWDLIHEAPLFVNSGFVAASGFTLVSGYGWRRGRLLQLRVSFKSNGGWTDKANGDLTTDHPAVIAPVSLRGLSSTPEPLSTALAGPVVAVTYVQTSGEIMVSAVANGVDLVANQDVSAGGLVMLE